VNQYALRCSVKLCERSGDSSTLCNGMADHCVGSPNNFYTSCAAGNQLNTASGNCEACPTNQISANGGACSDCATDLQPNADKSACEAPGISNSVLDNDPGVTSWDGKGRGTAGILKVGDELFIGGNPITWFNLALDANGNRDMTRNILGADQNAGSVQDPVYHEGFDIVICPEYRDWNQGDIQVFDRASKDLVYTFADGYRTKYSMSALVDGDKLYTGNQQGKVHEFDIVSPTSFQFVRVVQCGGGNTWNMLTFGAWLVAAQQSNTGVEILNKNDLSKLESINTGQQVRAVTMTESGYIITGMYWDGYFKVINNVVGDRRVLHTVQAVEDLTYPWRDVEGLYIVGNTLITGASSGTIRFWDVSDEKIKGSGPTLIKDVSTYSYSTGIHNLYWEGTTLYTTTNSGWTRAIDFSATST